VLADRARVFALLQERTLATLWLGRLLQQTATWIVLLSLLVLSWTRSGEISVIAWTLAAYLLPRIVVVGLLDANTDRLPQLSEPVLWAATGAVAAALAVALVAGVASSVILVGAAGSVGSLAAVGNETRSRTLRSALGVKRLGVGALVDALVDRAGMFLGGLASAALLIALSPQIALLVAAALLAAAAALTLPYARALPKPSTADLAPWSATDPRTIARRAVIYLVAAFTGGALASVLIICSIRLAAAEPGWTPGYAALFVAAAGLGMLLGPLPVPRLLLRIPVPLLLLATSLTTALAVIVIALTRSVFLALVLLVVFGVAAVTQDAVRGLALRRLVPADIYKRLARLSVLALTVGQLYGAVGVVSISPTADPLAVLVLLAVSQVILLGIAIALGGRTSLQVGGLGSLPIKSVVHKLSWATEPEAQPADFAGAEPRAQRLARWINRQADLQRLQVTLPVSRREYEIYRPNDQSRERLFDQGRADPDKQLPYWAKVWPSGVALADVVVERKLEVADKHVLELGAGLGVTACAVLEYGGHLVTADYSALPLAHCRLNTLVNTGRVPSATCFNWRHDAEVTAALAQPEFRGGFPLIIAGDVLYEGRDAEPLLNVIERLLVDDGSLWLAEPVRKTAQRFLDSAATLGWEVYSRQVRADWPDTTGGPVNLHFLRRSPEPDRVVADLGGWRI
jgi:predicted nicotinamide N-methyase